jgi:hypothetical protein
MTIRHRDLADERATTTRDPDFLAAERVTREVGRLSEAARELAFAVLRRRYPTELTRPTAPPPSQDGQAPT